MTKQFYLKTYRTIDLLSDRYKLFITINKGLEYNIYKHKEPTAFKIDCARCVADVVDGSDGTKLDSI